MDKQTVGKVELIIEVKDWPGIANVQQGVAESTAAVQAR
jgi:hypothetical protein